MFLITLRDSEDLETDIFPIGEEDDIDAALAFTTEETAANYLQASGAGETHTVAELHPVDFLGWLLELHHNGVKLLVIDPDHDEFHEGEPQIAVDIESQLTECEERIVEIVRHAQDQ
jgi:hypothetical protein